MACCVVFAGAAGVGKTTLARILARELRMRFCPVDTRRCWEIRDAFERQSCFANAVRAAEEYGCVLDNAMVNVYAYDVLLTGGGYRELVEEEAERALAVYVDVDERTQKQRLYKRPTIRPTDVLARDYTLHITAQQKVAELLLAFNYDFVVANGAANNPWREAKRVARMIANDKLLY